MGTVVDRLSNLGDHTLYADCPNLTCQHSARLDVGRIYHQRGDLTLDQLRAMTRCSKCGKKPCGIKLGAPERYSRGRGY